MIYIAVAACVFLLVTLGLINSKSRLAIAVLVLSVYMTAIGGYIDMTGRTIYGITREHAWNDGIYLVLVSIAVSVLHR